MLKISSATPKKEESTKIKQKKKTYSVKQKENKFDLALQYNISFDFQGTIDELLNELKYEEQQFLERQTVIELNRYKSIVQKILKTILDEGIQTKTLKRMRKDRADYIVVDKINLKLMEIVDQVTNRNNKAFNLLKSIEEIRGLIFDLIY
jgi:uncharacterized protein YaaR (DUF327 family)